MADPFTPALALAAAVHRGDAEATRAAALDVEASLGAGAGREVLRQLHLYFGFPRLVQAWNACWQVLPANDEVPGAKPLPPERATGEALFRELYGEDAAKVLPHLEKLDPLFTDWILSHAYARVLARPRLNLAEKERLAVACLAATRCWKQWESHVAIALRHGVDLGTLRADLNAAGAWLGAEASAHARAALDVTSA